MSCGWRSKAFKRIKNIKLLHNQFLPLQIVRSFNLVSSFVVSKGLEVSKIQTLFSVLRPSHQLKSSVIILSRVEGEALRDEHLTSGVDCLENSLFDIACMVSRGQQFTIPFNICLFHISAVMHFLFSVTSGKKKKKTDVRKSILFKL